MQSLVILLALFLVLGGAFSQSKQQKQKTEDVQISVPTPTPSPQPEPTPSAKNNFQYPISRIVTQNETSLTLESVDDADAITDWYKEKIKTMGMNTKSFVTTKTNGNIKNVLVGANGKEELRAEISKSNNESTVRIVVTYRTY